MLRGGANAYMHIQDVDRGLHASGAPTRARVKLSSGERGFVVATCMWVKNSDLPVRAGALCRLHRSKHVEDDLIEYIFIYIYIYF